MNAHIPEIFAVLKTTAERWNHLTDSLPTDLLSRRPVPDTWSARDCLQHLIDTEKVFLYRVQCFLEGRDFPNFDPNVDGSKPVADRPAAELAREFAVVRQNAIGVLQKLSEEDLDRRARHSDLGLVTLREMLYEWAGHDLMHLSQVNRALLQPFLLNCGPWKRYYTKYVIS